MGCDIHAYLERHNGQRWEYVADAFDVRQYGLFGWLADVRNYSAVPPISPPCGLPGDVTRRVRRDYEEWGFDAHTASWHLLEGLLAFDYDATFEDRRVRLGNDYGHTAEPGGGKVVTYREFLGGWYFAELERLKLLADGAPARLVFWFDN
ncbi:hypothetical protein [Nocardia puris]|uniref:hypothetical protein n=1 Tax=Nocardia puris TaxID=208602 RepID=UPI002E1BF2CD